MNLFSLYLLIFLIFTDRYKKNPITATNIIQDPGISPLATAPLEGLSKKKHDKISQFPPTKVG